MQGLAVDFNLGLWIVMYNIEHSEVDCTLQATSLSWRRLLVVVVVVAGLDLVDCL